MRGAILYKWSVRRTVLTLLIPALLVVGAIEMWSTYRTAVDAANSAYDRSLLGAIKAIDANISTASGGVSVELPYTMLEFFQLTAAGNVHFRVGTEDGLVEIGSFDLPHPPQALETKVPQFYDAVYFGQRVRIGSYARELGVAGGSQLHSHGRIVIQVAEALTSRSDFINALLLQALRRDFLLLAAAIGILALVLHLTLKPLARLRDEVSSRSPADLTPIATTGVPVDLRPLADAINLHMARTQGILEGQRRFIDDASHQLRTPLATLRTQLDYVLRETDPANVQQALDAVSRQLNLAIRRTNQMLALGHADAVAAPAVEVNILQLARRVVREVVPAAREKKLDLEFDSPEGAVTVLGHEGLLREALLNLLHNAVQFAPEGGNVVLRLRQAGGLIALSVSDDGPGIPEADLPHIGRRFYRASNSSADGSGLGLAIARAVAESHGGGLRIENGGHGRGCNVILSIPTAAQVSGV
ncbi:sensor histidine kinase [Noviherbaspirillum aerium]|uniref:sensor histidine kinase n=1 Tax=Noviherbaspirillum aerium TaxID=2588497 RepID=UPI00124D79F8|nr:sensor histidine kinase [Noviherbaspirillum aerium]